MWPGRILPPGRWGGTRRPVAAPENRVVLPFLRYCTPPRDTHINCLRSTLWKVRPGLAAFRLARSHFHTLNNLSLELSDLGVILLTIGASQYLPQIANFPQFDWPTFCLSPGFIEAAMRKHNVPAGAYLPPAMAAAMFTEIRDFAFQLAPVWRIAFVDSRVFAPMEGWLPPAWTTLYWPSHEQLKETLARWGDIVGREDELEQWLMWAEIVTSRARRMVRGASVPAQERSSVEPQDCGGLLANTGEENGSLE